MVTSREGAQSHAIDLTAQGLVSRGVLLDIAKVRGVDWLSPDAPVMPEDLDAAERDHGVTVQEGDILLVRTGNYRRRLVDGPVPGTEPSVACHVACAPWFKERGIAMLGTDTSNDIRPNQYENIVSPLHIGCLVYLGVWLIDNANLEDVAEVAAPPRPVRVHAVDWRAPAAQRDRQPRESHRDFLGLHGPDTLVRTRFRKSSE